MIRLRVLLLATCAIVALPLHHAGGSEADDKAQKTFETLYGEDFKRASSSRDPALAVALAAKLLDAAKSSETQPALMALLAVKACALGSMDPTGYETALAAAALVAEKAPELAGPCQDRIVAMRQKQYEKARGEEKTKTGEALVDALMASATAKGRAGETEETSKCLQRALGVARAIKSPKADAVEIQIRAIAERQKAQTLVTQLKAQVQADPANAKARDQLVRLLLVDFDNPEEAAGYLSESGDAAFRKFVLVAVKPVADVPEMTCCDMADWYLQLATAAGPAGKAAMFNRVRAYAKRFLELHQAKDFDRTRTELALKKAESELAQAGPASESKSAPSSLTLDLGKGVTLKLARIPPGRFMMGSPDSEPGRVDAEGPQHEVAISRAYYMGATEVTQAQYEAVMAANPSNFKGPTNPVERVLWTEAVEFCRRLSEKTRKMVRLPTEAEWEYACRAGSPSRFSFGDANADLADHGWFLANSANAAHPVSQKKPNAWGLHDMHGNLWEWCLDWMGPYGNGSVVDPQGPASGAAHVLRSGSWANSPPNCRAALRFSAAPDARSNRYGFRVVVVGPAAAR